ncbi:Glucan endo-1,3-beta-glucosidase-beta-glucanase, putative isoform 1 [Hibiscus syriacus]|uniref:Glucan endo-1,3-beta-glucosidase-beta-glucanase, putative isoform 1 n=1 Tax=Hibiscus syriacus TaxID=106335 RepID=A0A6A2ZXJ7_HIBSY|nr:Glucan endo-1,3-beta-glucosidase-beta-glucanase, putative isoform 1 [Hibiscus syriacus]
MQSDQQFYSQKAVPTLADQVGNSYMHIPAASPFGTVFPLCAKPLPPLHGIEFQPSDVCPKNFVIFDQTENRNQILFNPAITNKFNEDSDDIDALLSSEEEGGQVEYDEEEVNTACTFGNYEVDSADSHSARGSKSRKNSLSSNPGGCDPEIKRMKMKKMVKVLREIVPGADQMGTVAFLDEAVRYLKSLKVEVQQLGVENFKNED